MTETLSYIVQEYNDDYKNIFKGVYSDFKNRAFSDYKFELNPLEYEDFIDSINNGLIKCIITQEMTMLMNLKTWKLQL